MAGGKLLGNLRKAKAIGPGSANLAPVVVNHSYE